MLGDFRKNCPVRPKGTHWLTWAPAHTKGPRKQKKVIAAPVAPRKPITILRYFYDKE